jgi:hypothetical protein
MITDGCGWVSASEWNLSSKPIAGGKHVKVLAHPAQDRDDTVEYIGVLMDITAAKQAEEALQELQDQSQFDGAKCVTVHLDKGKACFGLGAGRLGNTFGSLKHRFV